MMKIFKDKKNIAIAASLFLAAVGTGMSVFALTKKPDCPPPGPETHCSDHFEKHERPDHHGDCPKFEGKHDECKGECKGEHMRECPPPRCEKGCKHGDKELRPEEPKKDSVADEKSENHENPEK